MPHGVGELVSFVPFFYHYNLGQISEPACNLQIHIGLDPPQRMPCFVTCSSYQIWLEGIRE